MDILNLETFIEIASSGSFVRAAERLHVTQTTVTARIKSLESMLGTRLFVRNRAGAKLTNEGEAFLPQANNVLQAWKVAKKSVTLSSGKMSSITLGSENNLWNPLLIKWIHWLSENQPELAINAKISDAESIDQSLKDQKLDGALIHLPNYYSGLHIEQVMEEKLIHVENCNKPLPNLHIDWGTSFDETNRLVASVRESIPYSFDLGPAALNFMLNFGGNGWFRTRVVQPYLNNGRLRRIPNQSEFTYPIYLAYQQNLADLHPAVLDGLRRVARMDAPWLI
ncbi:LysR family transcriptional regulator [Marinobacterium stanieri]|uniref:DNA-binding transcriptional regulator, LysR family n=1 Tax=Marinobacterium stanieri TaxID=49186 RepID=A0A1N6X9G4_9GAMM|nr:LysR family transcriptional regulator [Marinobacterium stanieri]SIQ98881.1 DNA-binding transcriptional regulator, LysR family [Marinobacterium stanieri]